MSEPATDEEIEHLERTGKLPSTLRLIARIRQQQKVIATLTPPPSALVEGGEKPVGYLNERSGVFVSTAYFAGLGESSRSKYAPLFATRPPATTRYESAWPQYLALAIPVFAWVDWIRTSTA